MKRFLSLLTVLAFIGITNVWGLTATKTEGFQAKSSDTYYQGDVTIATTESDCGIAWSIYYGNVSTTGAINGTKSCLMRYYTASSSNLGYARTTTAIKGLTNVTFNAKVTQTGCKMGVWYSNNGTDWEVLATGVTLTTSSASKSYDIPNSSVSKDYYIKIGLTAGTTNKKDLIIDNIALTYTAYSVSYDKNGGSGTMTDSNSPYMNGSTVTVKSNSFTAPTGKTFNGWKTGATSGTSYAAGATFSISANTTLYAQWACITPTISSQTVSSATYTAGDTPSNLSVTASGGSLSYQWKQSATENGTYVNVTSGTGGTTATYTPSTSAASDLWYQCTVTNTGSSCGTTALSNKAHIVVNEAVACTATPSIGAVSLNGPFFVTHLKIFHHIIMSMFASFIL